MAIGATTSGRGEAVGTAVAIDKLTPGAIGSQVVELGELDAATVTDSLRDTPFKLVAVKEENI